MNLLPGCAIEPYGTFSPRNEPAEMNRTGSRPGGGRHWLVESPSTSADDLLGVLKWRTTC